MGNNLNKFSNKSEQLSLYCSISTNATTGITKLRHTQNNLIHLMKTITTDSQKKCQDIERISLEKININKTNKPRQVPITQLTDVFVNQAEQYCGFSYQISLVFEVGDKTLRDNIQERRKDGMKMYDQREILEILRNLALGISFYKQIQQPHQHISSSNLYMKGNMSVLADPMISIQQGVYESPQKLEMMINHKVSYDWFVSDLYSIGMIALEAYHLKTMHNLYQNQQINILRLKQQINKVKYQQVQRLIRELLGPQRLRVQALSQLITQPLSHYILSHAPPSPLKPLNNKQTAKKQVKKQMRKEIKQAKEGIKKMIQNNSKQLSNESNYRIQTKRLEQPKYVSIEKRGISKQYQLNRIGNSVDKSNKLVVQNVHNYTSHIHIHHPPEIKYHTAINLTINQNSHSPSQSIHYLKQPQFNNKPKAFHRHTRSNSNHSVTAIKPSTSSTHHHMRRNSSSNHTHQQFNLTIRQQQHQSLQQIMIKVMQPTQYTPNINLLKQTNHHKGILNTTVSSHGLDKIMNSSYSLSNLNQVQLNQSMNKYGNNQSIVRSGNMFQRQPYIQQFSSLINPSHIDQLNINSSMISNHSNKSNHSNLSNHSNHNKSNININHNNNNHNNIFNQPHTQPILVKHSHSRSNSSISSSSHSHSSVILNTNSKFNNFAPYNQFNTTSANPHIKTIINTSQISRNQSSLHYSKSLSKQRNHQFSDYSFDFPLLTKVSSKIQKNNPDCSQSCLLNSHHTHRSNKSLSNSIPNTSINNKNTLNQYHYEGSLKNNMRQGDGKLYLSTGRLIYQGQFRNNVYQGYGKLANQNINIIDQIDYNNLDLREGYWINYQGSFIKGQIYGFGKIVFCNGQVYEGEFVDGQIQGFGQFWNQRQEVLDGVWKAGKLQRLI